jgi:hypothetical protein
MKAGCIGCFLMVIVILAVLVLAVGTLLISGNVFRTPEARPVTFSRADGYAAQQKLYEVVLRQAGRSSRKDPISLTEREASAFLSRHLADSARVPLSDLSVRFEPGEFIAQGQTPLRSLVQGPIFSYLVPYIPDKPLDQSVWVSIRGRINIETSAAGTKRYGQVTLTRFVLGRQPVSPILLYVMMGPSGAGLLEWPVPQVVESVKIERGQAVIRTR